MKVVTTFARRHWDSHARDMVTSFDKFWSKDFELHCYVNGGFDGIPRDVFPRVTFHDHYKRDPELWEFIRRYEDVTKPLIWLDGRYEYRWDVCRFAHKVFALSHAMRTGREPVMWMDADVVMKAPVNLGQFYFPGHDFAYLGRQGFAPETGFMWFAHQDPVEEVKRYYTSADVFNEPEWHDGYLWGLVFPHYNSCNISAGIEGKHVWPHTFLGEFSEHRKGPARKRAGSDLPDAIALKEPEQVREPV